MEMREVFEREIQDNVIVWTDGDVYHIPTLDAISLDRDRWKIGQRVCVTIELIQMPKEVEG